MNAPAKVEEILNADIALLKPGMPFAGGFYVGQYNHNGQTRLLIVAPKDAGDLEGTWNNSWNSVEGALSFFDGLANTDAMAAAGSELATKVRALRIGGHDDWHIPAIDQLELVYRALKPTDDENDLYARSGINVSAIPPSYPYTSIKPAQCQVEAFREDGSEAFERAWYWTSTLLAVDPGYAWMQGFGNGNQNYYRRSNRVRARAVRSLII